MAVDFHPDVEAAIRIESRGRKRVIRKAAYATAIVEARGQNPRHGHLDSLGSFQQRPSQGWGSRSQVLDPRYAARQFVKRAEAILRENPGISSAELAQAVQRSAFPERYGAHEVQAQAQRMSRSGGGQVTEPNNSVRPGRPGSTDVSLQSHTIPGQSFEGERRALRRNLLLGGRTDFAALSEYAAAKRQLKDVPAQQVLGDLRVKRTPGKPVKIRGRDVDAPQVGGQGQIYEVFYDPLGEYYDSGAVHRGSIGDHVDHVHVSGDKAKLRRLGKLAQSMKLNVGENSMFTGQRVTSGHTEGSFHYKDEAIDVSGSPAAMRKFARIVMREARRGRGR